MLGFNANIVIRIGCYVYFFIIAVLTMSDFPWKTLIALGFGHYILSLIYAWPSVKKVFFNWKQGLLFGFTLFFTWWIWRDHGGLLFILFICHHAITETYQGTEFRFDKGFDFQQFKYWAVLRFVFELSSVFAITKGDKHSMPVTFFSDAEIFSVVLVSFVSIVLFYAKFRDKFPRQYRKETIVLPVVTLVVVLFTKFSGLFPNGISWLYILSFHGMVWTWLPLVRRSKRAMYSLPLYFGITIGVFVLFGLWAYPLKAWSKGDWETFYGLFLFFGYFHITTSVIFSRYNPMFIVRWVRAI